MSGEGYKTTQCIMSMKVLIKEERCACVEFFLPTVSKFLVIGGHLISLCYCRVFTLQYNAP